MPWQSSYPTSDASQRPFGKQIQHMISSPQVLSLLGSPIWGNLVMHLMENTVFHKTLLCLQSCILSYFPTGRENDKLSSTIRQPLEYLKTITLLPLPSLPKLTASRCPTSSMLCHCSKKTLAFQWPSKNKDPRAEDSTEWPWSSGRLCCTQQQRHHIAPRLKEDPIPISYIKWWESRYSSFYTDMILI